MHCTTINIAGGFMLANLEELQKMPDDIAQIYSIYKMFMDLMKTK